MKKISATIGFAAAMVGLTGCSLFSITPAPTEPQQTVEPADGTVVTVIPIDIGIAQDKLEAPLVKTFKLPEGTKIATKQYELDGGAEWELQPAGEWQMVYVFSGNGYARISDYEMPLSIGSGMLVPAGKTVKVINVSKDKLVVVLAVPEGAVLPDMLVQQQRQLSDASNYNGMSTVSPKDLGVARGFDDIKLPARTDGSPWENPRSETLSNITEPNPLISKADKDSPAKVMADGQRLTPEEAKIVQQDIKETATPAELEQLKQEQ